MINCRTSYFRVSRRHDNNHAFDSQSIRQSPNFVEASQDLNPVYIATTLDRIIIQEADDPPFAGFGQFFNQSCGRFARAHDQYRLTLIAPYPI